MSGGRRVSGQRAGPPELQPPSFVSARMRAATGRDGSQVALLGGAWLPAYGKWLL